MGQLQIHGLFTVFLILIPRIDYTTALYGSESKCALKTADSVTCPSSGVSNPGAVIGNFITTTTVYVTATSTGNTIYVVARGSYTYLSGVTAAVSFGGVIGYVIVSKNKPIAYINVVNCPSISRFNNTDSLIPYTRTLTFSMLYQSISIANQPRRGPCNIFKVVNIANSPAVKGNLDPGPVINLDGISSIQIAQLGTPSGYVEREATVGGINVYKDGYGKSVFVTQKQSPLSAPCLAKDVAGVSDVYTDRIVAYTEAALNNPDALGAMCKIAIATAEGGAAVPSTGIVFTRLILIQPPDKIVVIVGYTQNAVVVGSTVALFRSC